MRMRTRRYPAVGFALPQSCASCARSDGSEIAVRHFKCPLITAPSLTAHHSQPVGPKHLWQFLGQIFGNEPRPKTAGTFDMQIGGGFGGGVRRKPARQ